MLELDDGGDTRDELLLNGGALELLKRLLADGELLLDWSLELELPPGIELDNCALLLLLDGLPGLELLDPPGMLLLELCLGMYDDELEYSDGVLLLCPPLVVPPPLPPCPCPQGGAHGTQPLGGYGGKGG